MSNSGDFFQISSTFQSSPRPPGDDLRQALVGATNPRVPLLNLLTVRLGQQHPDRKRPDGYGLHRDLLRHPPDLRQRTDRHLYKEAQFGGAHQPAKHVYSVWALPPEDVRERLKKLMSGLWAEFGGPKFEPHITVVGTIILTEDDALDKFQAACKGLKAYAATVEKVAIGTFFYQCVFLLLHPTPEGLSDEEKKKAQERANILDENIGNLSFQITRLALYETDPEDKTLKSWKKIAECNLDTN